ncbi:Lectin L6 [Hondaea fermentalgiana]|uniref:Lectin L6 n=1 Tax=Hondaea fermentalgiana TaxID=2315210 RepID=A0A2R5H094_9STRA|nr:Lectin L6 [Hondaea fermentalgiana]|eukprot:GBG34473.1 Lectin L6 [Hondaea fermentalgiana]
MKRPVPGGAKNGKPLRRALCAGGKRNAVPARKKSKKMTVLAVTLAIVLALTADRADGVTPLGAAVESDSGYTFLIAESNSAVLQSLHETGDDVRKGSYNFLTYTMGMLIDPCKGHSADCCTDIFGEPEYLRRSVVIPKGWVWALGAADDSIYNCRMPCIGNWTLINDTKTIHDFDLDVIDSDADAVWGLSLSEDKLFTRNLDGSTDWTFISGSFTTVSASGSYAVYAVNRNDPLEILACLKPCDGQWNPPVEVSGHPSEGTEWTGPDLNNTVSSYKAINADDTHIWLIVEDGRIFSRRVLLPSTGVSVRWKDVWIEDSAYGQWIDVSPPGVGLEKVATCIQTDTIWALTDTGALMKCPRSCTSDQWVQVPYPGSGLTVENFDLDDQYVWAVASDNGIYRRSASSETAGSSWSSIPSATATGNATVDARKTVPSGGFKRITAPAFMVRTDTYTEYTVEEYGQDCALTLTEDACALKTTERCEWNVDLALCEKRIDSSNSRFPDLDVVFDDPTCIIAEVVSADGSVSMEPGFALTQDHEEETLGITRDPQCVEHGIRMATSADMPACWDHNETVRADESCTDAEGNAFEHCVAIGYSATVFIPKCGGAYADSNACGAFIELHAAGEAHIINEVKLPSDVKFTNGYRTLVMPLEFANNTDRLICGGEYELWWTQRTRKRQIVEAIKRFHVEYPPCDWNIDEDAYETYATISS